MTTDKIRESGGMTVTTGETPVDDGPVDDGPVDEVLPDFVNEDATEDLEDAASPVEAVGGRSLDWFGVASVSGGTVGCSLVGDETRRLDLRLGIDGGGGGGECEFVERLSML